MKYILSIVLSLLSLADTGNGKDQFVLNKGMPGNNVCNLMKRLNRAVLKHHPSLVIVLIGTNDMVNPPKMLSYSTYSSNLNMLVDRIRKSGADVLLLTPPYVDTDYIFARHRRKKFAFPPNEKIDSVKAIIHKTAMDQDCMYLDINQVFSSYDSPSKAASSLIRNEKNSWMADGVHPTSRGYRVIAESVYAFLKNEGKSYDKIICFGDSITFGAYSFGQGTNRGKTYPAVLRKLLSDHHNN